MTKDKEKKVGKDQLLLEASRLGQTKQLESILSQMRQIKSKKKTNPLASLRKTVGPNSVRDPVTGFTCLHHAALNGHSECVRLILSHGAKLNAVDYKGSSALHLAAWAGNVDVVRTLIHHKAPPQPGASGSADRQSPPPAQQLIRQLGGSCSAEPVDLDLCNNDNQTPLSLAAQFGHSRVVAELLASGANVHLRNSQQESPLELACLNGRLETVDLLLGASSELAAELRRPRATLTLGTNELTAARSSGLQPTCAGIDRPLSESLTGSQQQQQSPGGNRRPSAGWSSLLRGRRESAAAANALAGSGSANSPSDSIKSHSPLHRLTSGTLSMRQKSPAAGGRQQPEVGNKENSPAENRDRTRRATLTVGAPILSSPQLRQQNSTDAHWPASGQQQKPDDRMLLLNERLLDHSPLHYAVRRGHLEIVNLLLRNYGANVLQVTSLGGVLHELALNNGKNSDMIKLLFNHIGLCLANQQQPQVSFDLLERFLNLRNAQQKSVFEVLNDINNRSAQELKRLIYEFSEQIGQQISKFRLQTGGNINNNNTHLLHHHQQPQYSSSQATTKQFLSDSHMLDPSFVTMKRAPKLHRPLPALSGEASLQHSHQQLVQFPGTQTIDRRHTGQSSGSGMAAWQQHSGFQSQDGSRQQQQQPTSAMTRSVSNLSRRLQQPATGNQLPGAQIDPQDPLVWAQWQQQQQQQSAEAVAARRRRSRSRDLGSLLLEAAQSRQSNQSQQANQQQADQQQYPIGPLAAAQHLVRSQTDCSHLMGRYFEQGAHSPAFSSASASSANFLGSAYSLASGRPQTAAAMSGDHQPAPPQQHQTLDRKTINRHYHVYEHEFYPPRLLQQQQPGSSNAAANRQAVAVVPPLSRQQQQQQPEVGGHLQAGAAQLRSSTRSNASSASVRSQPARPPLPLGYCSSFGAGASAANSRLSLNIEPPASSCLPVSGAPLSVDQRATEQQQQQMDRFLTRHTRKSSVAGSQASRGDAEAADQRRALDLHLRQSIELSNSQSLESRLSEPQLFEAARQALLRDFDQMIGQELLNRNHRQIFADGTGSGNQPAPSASKLTGVMLDMDRHGDQLTVSGTRVTMPQQPQTGDRRAARAEAATSLLSQGTQTGGRSEEAPPPKPPRLSLLNRSSSGLQASAGKLRAAAIYDLPVTSGEPSPTTQRVGANCVQRSKTIAVGGSCSQISAKAPHSSLTDPPKMRPPPLPAGPLATGPLHVVPPLAGARDNYSGAATSAGLLRLASSTGNSSAAGSNSSLVTGSNSQPQNHHHVAQQQAQQSSSSLDPDSGVCTSNSPASISHDSEGPATGNEAASGLGQKRMKQQQAPEVAPSSSAVVRHLARVSGTQRAAAAASGEPPVSPPSPKTAQLCIEQALLPLAQKIDEQTPTSCATMRGAPFMISPSGCSTAEAIGRWLVVANAKSPDDLAGNSNNDNISSNSKESGYENCSQLQRELAQQDARRLAARSLSSASASSSASPSSSGGSEAGGAEDLEEGDYAAQSVSSVKDSSSSSSSCKEASTSATSLSSASSLDPEPEVANGTQRKEVLLKVVVDESEQSANGDEVFYMNPSELKKIAMKRSQAEAETLTDEELCAAIDKDSGYIRFTLRKRRNNNQSDESSSENNRPISAKSPNQSVESENQIHSLDEQSHSHSSAKRTKLLESNIEPQSSDQNNNKDLAKHASGQTTGPQRQQGASKLRHWFATKLAGLSEYSDKFLSNGLDDLNYLNHPKLLNDHLLSSIGIGDATHRALVLECVRNELPPVDFEQLDLDYSQLPVALGLDSNRVDLAPGARKNLPLGHRLRLEVALEFLSDRKRQREVSEGKISTAETDDIEDDPMDLQLKSPSTNSSASKDSIKSIISLKESKLPVAPVAPIVVEASLPPRPTEQKTEPETETRNKQELPTEKREPQSVVQSSPQPPSSLSPKNLRKISTGSSGSGSSSLVSAGNSLVSEVARRLEAAAAQRTDLKASLRPVAAARRINSTEGSTNKSDKLVEATNNQKQSPRKAFVPVKSVCWPPKSGSNSDKENECLPPVNKINATKSLFQSKLEQETTIAEPQLVKQSTVRIAPEQAAQSASDRPSITSASARPKPAPPKKPAKLAAASKQLTSGIDQTTSQKL